MPKSSKKQIDIDEKRILRELESNAKESIDVIARKCGFSRQKVWRVIKNLEESKTIWGYHAVVDNAKIGLNRYFILIKRTNKAFSSEHIITIIQRALRKENAPGDIIIDGVSYVHGDFDGIHEVRAKSINQVKHYCENLNKISKGFIAEMTILEELFPIEKGGNPNPNIDELKNIFLTE